MYRHWIVCHISAMQGACTVVTSTSTVLTSTSTSTSTEYYISAIHMPGSITGGQQSALCNGDIAIHMGMVKLRPHTESKPIS